jgi:hypothetical protein
MVDTGAVTFFRHVPELGDEMVGLRSDLIKAAELLADHAVWRLYGVHLPLLMCVRHGKTDWEFGSGKEVATRELGGLASMHIPSLTSGAVSLKHQYCVGRSVSCAGGAKEF